MLRNKRSCVLSIVNALIAIFANTTRASAPAVSAPIPMGKFVRAYYRALVLVALTIFLAPATPALATTIIVTSYSDGAANANNCPGASCRLRDAIAAANSGDKITFSSKGHTIALTQGELNLTQDVTIFFNGSVGDIVIDAQSASRAVIVSSGTATFDTLVIENGAAALGHDGGAIHVNSGAILNLNNVNIESSRVSGAGVGGAIYNTGTLNITGNDFFTGNTTASGGGGAGGVIYNDGVANLTGKANSDGSRSLWFYGNNADTGGGTIYNNGTITATNIQINSSAASNGNGGAILNNGDLSIYQSLVVYNSAIECSCIHAGTQGVGGGIDNLGSGTLTIWDSSISTNTAAEGGGIANAGTMTIYRSLVYNNSAGDLGGGISNSTSGNLTLINTTLSTNSASFDGGGIYIAGGDADLNNITITKNTADSDNDGVGDGGGIYDGCPSNQRCIPIPITVTVKNTISSGNFDTPNNSGPGNIYPDCGGVFTSHGYNLIHDTSGCSINGNTTGNILSQFADLAPLAENGGWTPTHALNPNSPAINAGNPAIPGSGGNACAPHDQRDYPRGGGAGQCDIGAYERTFLLFLPLIMR